MSDFTYKQPLDIRMRAVFGVEMHQKFEDRCTLLLPYVCRAPHAEWGDIMGHQAPYTFPDMSGELMLLMGGEL
jgi:hypothetical protein